MKSWLEQIEEFIFNMFINGIRGFLDMIEDLFSKSVNSVRDQVAETPTEFSPDLVDTLRTLSETAVLPVAGLLLTYIFCYELYQMIVEKNRGSDFETGQLLFLIIKTSAAILLLTHSFDITLAFFDLGKWMTDQVPNQALNIPGSIEDNIIASIGDGNIGYALSMWIVSGIALIIIFIMSMVIYLVAWSRMVTIMLYISVAPLPFATFLNNDWIGSIGQNYIKNLIALMLQGYFMLVCLIVYAGLLGKASDLIFAGDVSALYALMLMIVSMGILVVTLTRTHSLAKSVMGVV